MRLDTITWTVLLLFYLNLFTPTTQKKILDMPHGTKLSEEVRFVRVITPEVTGVIRLPRKKFKKMISYPKYSLGCRNQWKGKDKSRKKWSGGRALNRMKA